MHYPEIDTVDEEFFAQLCAEHREEKYNKAGIATGTVWVLDRERNEALDCAVLSLAALRLLNPNIRQMLEALAGEPKPAPVEAEPEQQQAPEPKPRKRRIGRSNYLSGR